jgi:hypothetical protein
MTTGQIFDIAPGDFTSAAAASATKAEIERTTNKTVKYVFAFRTGKDSMISDDYLIDSRLEPVLVDKEGD